MKPGLPPLSHHEILAQVGPFTRRGRAVDLACSDRARRLLAFQPVQHAAANDLPALRETLTLDLADPERARLVRELAAPDGLSASLQADGRDAGELLAMIEAVPPARQLRRIGDARIALRHRLEQGAPVLREAEARLPGLTLRMTLTGVSGYPAEITLHPADDAPAPAFPSDLLAVQGRAWGRITRAAGGWTGSVELRGRGERRGLAAEAALERCVQHLQHTLAEAPARFHPRHRAARWGLALREMVPMGIGVGLVALALVLQRLGTEHSAKLALMANVAPPLLMMLFFLRREMPHIGLPRVPRRLRDDAW
jgi:hypothetical protein